MGRTITKHVHANFDDILPHINVEDVCLKLKQGRVYHIQFDEDNDQEVEVYFNGMRFRGWKSHFYPTYSKPQQPTGDEIAANVAKAIEDKKSGIPSQFEAQVGGEHYVKKGIQPIEYIYENNLDFFQGNIIKYCTRFRDKNGAEDLKKVIHYAQFLLELDFQIKSKVEYNG